MDLVGHVIRVGEHIEELVQEETAFAVAARVNIRRAVVQHQEEAVRNEDQQSAYCEPAVRPEGPSERVSYEESAAGRKVLEVGQLEENGIFV